MQLVSRGDIEKLVENWRDLYTRKMYNLAQFELESALKRAPEEAAAHFLLGQTFLAQHRPQAAKECFEKAQELLRGRATHLLYPQLQDNLQRLTPTMLRKVSERLVPEAPLDPFGWLEDPASAEACAASATPTAPENRTMNSLTQSLEASERALQEKLAELDRHIAAPAEEFLNKYTYNPGLGDQPVTLSGPRPDPVKKDPRAFTPPPAPPMPSYIGMPASPEMPSAASLLKPPPPLSVPEIGRVELPPKPEIPKIDLPPLPKPEPPRYDAPRPPEPPRPQAPAPAAPQPPTARAAEPPKPAAQPAPQPVRPAAPQPPPAQPVAQPAQRVSPPQSLQQPSPTLNPAPIPQVAAAAAAAAVVEQRLDTAAASAKGGLNRAEDAWKSWENALTKKINERKFPDALKQVDTALVRHSDSLFLQEWRAKILEQSGNAEGALRQYSESLRNAATQGANAEVERFLSRAKVLAHNNGDRLALVASALVAAGLISQALPFLRDAANMYRRANNQAGLSVILSQLRRYGSQEDVAAAAQGLAASAMAGAPPVSQLPQNLGEIISNRQSTRPPASNTREGRGAELPNPPMPGMPNNRPRTEAQRGDDGRVVGGLIMMFFGLIFGLSGIAIVPIILAFIANSIRQSVEQEVGKQGVASFMRLVSIVLVICAVIGFGRCSVL